MANLTYVRPGGVWTDLAGLTAADIQKFDKQLVKAPNFAEGGAYAPTGKIIIGGEGIELTTPAHFADLLITGDITATGDISLYGSQIIVVGNAIFETAVRHDGPFTQNAPSTFNGTVAITGGVSLSASLNVGGAVSFTSTFDVAGAITAQGGGALYGTYQFFNSLIIGNGFGTSAELRTAMVTSGLGRVVRPGLIATKASDTYSPALNDWVTYPGGLLTANGANAQISDSNCVDGDEIGFTNNSPSYYLLVVDPGGNGFPLYAQHWVVYKRFSGTWVRVRHGSFFKHSVDD